MVYDPVASEWESPTTGDCPDTTALTVYAHTLHYVMMRNPTTGAVSLDIIVWEYINENRGSGSDRCRFGVADPGVALSGDRRPNGLHG